MRSVSSSLSWTSLFLFVLATNFTSVSADSINRDCGFFATSGAGFNNVDGFQLAAFEEGAANASAVPLALEINPRLHYLSIVDLQLIQSTTFGLVNGTLYANDTASITEVAKPVRTGSVVSFSRTTKMTPISQFCAIANTDPEGGSPNPTLALDGDPSSFSICKTNTIPASSSVVYNATAESKSYNIKNCVKVQIRLLSSQ